MRPVVEVEESFAVRLRQAAEHFASSRLHVGRSHSEERAAFVGVVRESFDIDDNLEKGVAMVDAESIPSPKRSSVYQSVISWRSCSNSLGESSKVSWTSGGIRVPAWGT
jgi:hypothetical protein